MYLIAGLGNPGRDYEQTRHNVGFNVLEYFAGQNNININKIKFKALYGEGFIGSEKVLLLKPQTYMNLSGESILDAVQFYKLEMDKLIVIYDDISLPLGRIRIRPSGSDGGHNGMKSIIYLLGKNNFPRLRVGIGAPEYNMIDHVIGRFSNEESRIMDDVYKVASDAVAAIINNGIQTSMNRYNSYKHESLTENSVEEPPEKHL
jgi:PTH1 family peptidyl-tRNA hydrolase